MDTGNVLACVVERRKHVRGVVARIEQYDVGAAWMRCEPGRDVVHAPFHCDPAVRRLVVRAHIRRRELGFNMGFKMHLAHLVLECPATPRRRLSAFARVCFPEGAALPLAELVVVRCLTHSEHVYACWEAGHVGGGSLGRTPG